MLVIPQNKTVYDACLVWLGFKDFSGKRQKEVAFKMNEQEKMLEDQDKVRALTPRAGRCTVTGIV